MKEATYRERKKNNSNFSHFGPEANLLEELQSVFREYSEQGTGRTRHYVHDAEESKSFGQAAGTFTPWEELPKQTELLFYEGLHGAVVTDQVNTAQHADLKIGVVPVINLEWIQKVHRDRVQRGHSEQSIVETIL